MWHVLYVFKVDVCLLISDELVLEKDDMVAMMLRFALVAPGYLTLITCENDLLPLV